MMDNQKLYNLFLEYCDLIEQNHFYTKDLLERNYTYWKKFWAYIFKQSLIQSFND